jgi:signal transduction histidine kinase
MMERQLRQMVRLIDDLLDLGRVSRGKIELRRERIDINAAVRSAVEISQPLIERARHTLRIQSERPVYVVADHTRLAQVFANLLNNAAKYTPPGGLIELSVTQEARNPVTITVRDTGIGIPEAMLGKVFDIFTQVDHSRERTQGGLGIGLSIAKQLVELHEGRIEARSDGVGKGSEFTVRLPGAL